MGRPDPQRCVRPLLPLPGHARDALGAELPTGPLTSFNAILPQKCPAGNQPRVSPTEVPVCFAMAHVFGGRPPSHKTKAQSGAEDNDVPQQAGPLPPGLVQPPAGSRCSEEQTIQPAGAEVPPRPQVLLPILPLLPMTLHPSGKPTAHSGLKGGVHPHPVPHRAGAPCLSILRGELTCPWVPGTRYRDGDCHHVVRELKLSLQGGSLTTARGHQSWGVNQGCLTGAG